MQLPHCKVLFFLYIILNIAGIWKSQLKIVKTYEDKMQQVYFLLYTPTLMDFNWLSTSFKQIMIV